MKGHLKTMILAALADGECHAYALPKRLEDKTMGVFSLTEGTTYPTLNKLEKDGFIESFWKETEQGRKIKTYTLTKKGIKILDESKREWSFFYKALNLLFYPGN